MGKWTVFALVVCALLLGIGVGYYFGFDIGFERTKQENPNISPTPVINVIPTTAVTVVPSVTAGPTISLANEIVVNSPRTNQVVISPLDVAGRARGTWFFEANAGLKVVDENGTTLGQSYIQAIGPWMTTSFVNFEGTVTFDPKGSKKGSLIFENANPSGDPERSKELRIPVTFE